LPHHLSPKSAAYSGLSKSAAREQLGLPADGLLVTAAGFVTRAKQISMTLKALASLRGRVPPFKFVLAGERQVNEYDVDADIDRLGLGDITICTDYLDEDQFFKHLVAADILVNLRYPSGGEMSGSLVRALGLGVPTLVFDHGPMGELPDAIVKKVSWNERSQEALAEAFYKLMTDDFNRRELGARAFNYVSRVHDIAKSAERYTDIIRETGSVRPHQDERLKLHYPHAKFAARRLRQMDQLERGNMRQSEGNIWWRVGAVPLGNDPSHAALVVCADNRAAAALLSKIYDWRPESITVKTPDEFLAEKVRDTSDNPISAASFVFALVIVPAQIDEVSAAFLMRRLNAALRPGGSIMMETWLPSEMSSMSDAPLGGTCLRQRLFDAGFAAVNEWTPQDGLIADLMIPAKDNYEMRRFTCASARKVSEYAIWRHSDAPDGLPLRWGGRLNC
jgi:hypothetical protein